MAQTMEILIFAKKIWHRIIGKKHKQKTLSTPAIEERENPYLPHIREIIEQILEKKKIAYETFVPIIIDGENAEVTLEAMTHLGRDLNRLILLTSHPAYFTQYRDNMYEEQGLIIEIYPKTYRKISGLSHREMVGNVILDFEQSTERSQDIKFGSKIYIPIFKKTWESRGNLDIAVPIGYNTVIVSISKTEPKSLESDKFERAFYQQDTQ